MKLSLLDIFILDHVVTLFTFKLDHVVTFLLLNLIMW